MCLGIMSLVFAGMLMNCVAAHPAVQAATLPAAKDEGGQVSGQKKAVVTDLPTSSRVVSPLDYQVFQRNKGNQAIIRVAIDTEHGRGKVSARLVRLPTHTDYRPYAGQTTDWMELAETATGFTGNLLGVAGGQLQRQYLASRVRPSAAGH